MGFLKSRKVGNNFERQWANDTFKAPAQQLTQQGQSGLSSFMGALTGQDGGAGFNQFKQSIGYNNILGEAMRSIQGAMGARGLLNSGSTLKALQDRAGQIAGGTFNNWLGQLLQGSQAGLNAGQGFGNTVLGANQYTRQGGFNQFLQSAGQVAQGIGTGVAASDPRLKEDVELIDLKPDGLGVYRYRYEGEEDVRVGVMADEVAVLRPEALGPVIAGFLTVDYSKLPDVAHG